MPAQAFLVEIPANFPARHLINGVDKMVVFALDSTDAKAVAKSQFSGDANSLWDSATVTALAADPAIGGEFTMNVNIFDHTPGGAIVFDAVPVLGAISTTIQAGGTGYSANNILTVVGGTFSRAATFKVLTVSTGAVATIELVDPGEYTALPSNPAATTGAGSGCTLNLTGASNRLENLLANMVTKLNAHADIAAAALSLATSSRLLTIAGTSDNMGDENFIAEIRRNGVPIPGLLGTVTDGGSAGAALTVALPVAADFVLPKVYATARSR